MIKCAATVWADFCNVSVSEGNGLILQNIFFVRNRLKYALSAKEVQTILKQRLIKIDGKTRTDPK